MLNEYQIRFVNSSDCLQCLDVYEPYVLSSDITFDYELPDEEDYRHKIEDISKTFPWVVCTYNDIVIGYAYASQLRVKAAYQWTSESTIYLNQAYHGKGIAKIMYMTLFKILKTLGYYNVYAGVVIPNLPSEAFHRSFGFYEVGIYKKIGFKRGKWHDTLWLQYHLAEHVENPVSPLSINDSRVKDIIKAILIETNTILKTKVSDQQTTIS